MVFIWILVLVFFLLGILFACGKGSVFIAGYNTASEAEKSKYDEKRLHHCFAVFCFLIAIVIFMSGYVDTESFATYVTLPIVIGAVILLMIVSNTYCKIKQ